MELIKQLLTSNALTVDGTMVLNPVLKHRKELMDVLEKSAEFSSVDELIESMSDRLEILDLVIYSEHDEDENPILELTLENLLRAEATNEKNLEFAVPFANEAFDGDVSISCYHLYMAGELPKGFGEFVDAVKSGSESANQFLNDYLKSV